MKKTLYFIFVIYTSIFAQNYGQGGQKAPQVSGIVTGTVYDLATKKPLEYCNVVLHKTRDSSIVTGTVTESTGEFKIENVPAGRYYLTASFIGYDTKKVDSVFISPKSPERNVGKIYIRDHFYKLNDIVVTGEKQEVINNLDKKVINVDKNLASATGSAIDVLQNVPSVSVDVSGNVSLRGSTNVTILINGKPSGLVGVSGSDVLNQVPASSIESVEIVTNPSVKYDPDGTSGIINLVLKKKTDSGFNGLISVNAGTEDKYNTSVHTNYKLPGINFFLNYDNRFMGMKGTTENGRSSSFSYLDSQNNQQTVESFLTQNQSGKMRFGSNNINVGTDISFDDFNTLSLSYELRSMQMKNNTATQNVTEDLSQNVTRDYLRYNDFTRNIHSNEFGLTYKKTYERKNEDLTLDLSYEKHTIDGGQDISQVNYYPAGFLTDPQHSDANNDVKQFIGQLNFNFPFNEKSKIESGIKSTARSSETTNLYKYLGSSGWVDDINQTNDFTYDEQIHAVYSMITGELFDIKYQTGLRFEVAKTKGLQKYDSQASVNEPSSFTNDYTAFYPSIHLVKELTEGSELMLSLSRRVDRPRGRQLNTFVSLADSQNITVGNPALRPQFTNSYELGYAVTAGKTSVTSTVFYRHSTGIITSISYIIGNNITKTTYANLDKSNSYGIEFTLMQPVTAWWRLNANASYFNTEYISNTLDQNINKSSYSWLAKLNSMMQLPYGVQFQMMMNYNAPVIMPQSRVKAIFTSDMALKKDFMDGDLSLTLRVADVFHSQKNITETTGTNFILNSTDFRNSRVAYLGLSYRILNFNRSDDKAKRDNGDAMDY